MIKDKATGFANYINVRDFKCSQGRMANFAKRNNLKMHRLHGEAESANMPVIEADLSRIKERIDLYDPKDIYTFDETAVFYAAPPRTTIASHGFSGWKEIKKRLTVGLLCNADGTDRWADTLIIGHAKRPNCFNIHKKKQNAAAHGFTLYFSNKTAWMTKSTFHTFLRRFDNSMKYKNRKVLLLLDNFSGHVVDCEPTNVELLFLSPNTTSRLQPLDGGIIRAFKAHFKSRQYKKAFRYVGMIQYGNGDKVGPIDKVFEVDQLQAMKWIRESWASVMADTIKNCWNATIFRHIEEMENNTEGKVKEASDN